MSLPFSVFRKLPRSSLSLLSVANPISAWYSRLFSNPAFPKQELIRSAQFFLSLNMACDHRSNDFLPFLPFLHIRHSLLHSSSPVSTFYSSSKCQLWYSHKSVPAENLVQNTVENQQPAPERQSEPKNHTTPGILLYYSGDSGSSFFSDLSMNRC